MAQVLLTHSNNLYHDRKQIQKMQPYPPLQTLFAAAVLRGHGVDVALFDPTLNSPEDGFIEALDRHRPRLLIVCEDSFNFLSKMCLLRNREFAFWMAAKANERGISTAAHGPDAASNGDRYRAAGFETVLTGDIESQIAGLACAPNPGLVSIGHASFDSVPSPAWDLVDVEQYRRAWTSAHGYFSMNLVSSRGCPYQCNWCSKPVHGDRYHARRPGTVASEMRHLKTELRAEHIWFADDIFALSRKWTLEFSDCVARLDAQLPFKMQSRCDLMTRDTVAALARAGCAEIWMGVESGSKRILDAMEKGIRVEQVYEARENLRRHGIRACFFLQFGYPGEEWEDIQKTVQVVRDTQPDDIGVSVCYPLPGTKLYETVAAELGPKSNWSDSADLAMMFRGTYSSDFYRALAGALHLEVANGEGVEDAWARVEQLERASSRAALVTA